MLVDVVTTVCLLLCSPFKTQPSTGKNIVFEVVSKRAERVFFEHGTNLTQLLFGLLGIVASYKPCSFCKRHIRPIDAMLVIAVVWANQVVKDLSLIGSDGMDRIVRPGHVWAMGSCWAIVDRGTVVGHFVEKMRREESDQKLLLERKIYGKGYSAAAKRRPHSQNYQ